MQGEGGEPAHEREQHVAAERPQLARRERPARPARAARPARPNRPARPARRARARLPAGDGARAAGRGAARLRRARRLLGRFAQRHVATGTPRSNVCCLYCFLWAP